MAQRVFVRVIGFTDVERHALNTVFRLSEQRETIYSLWLADAPELPQLALVDGLDAQSRHELDEPKNAPPEIIWVGDDPPPDVWRTFERPISWPDVLQSMDQLFAPPPALDFDLDSDNGMADTIPPDLPPVKRALIASADRDERLYLRARLSLADLTQADEAETFAQALELTRTHKYAVALVDLALPDVSGWAFLKELGEAKPAIPHVILTKAQATLPEHVRAWLGGAKGLVGKPPDPGKLHALLERV